MSLQELVSTLFTALENDDAALAAASVHPAHVNHMAADEPRLAPGPAGRASWSPARGCTARSATCDSS